MTIGVITNPLSGGNRKGIGKIRGLLARNPGVLHREAVTPPEVFSVLADFSQRGIDLLVVNGGDGTVQSVLTAVYGRPVFDSAPHLALLRAGTASMLANDVGVRGEPVAALAKILAFALDGGLGKDHLHQRPVLKIDRQGEAPQCGMFFGVGAIPLGIELCHSTINPNKVRGELMPGLILARMVFSALTGRDKYLPPTLMEITLDASLPRKDSYMLAIVTTLERLFLGLFPFWGDESAPLHFTALRSNPPYLLRNLPFLLRGRRTNTSLPENGYYSQNAGKIDLNLRGDFTLDGEIFEAKTPLTIEPAGPASFLRI